MPEVLVPVNVEIWCTCGEGLCLQSSPVNEGDSVWDDCHSTGPAFVVAPCKVCSKKKLVPRKKRAEEKK